MVGARPIDPVIALRTTSHFMPAISVEALAPSMTVTPGRALRSASAFLTTPTVFTPYFFACAMS